MENICLKEFSDTKNNQPKTKNTITLENSINNLALQSPIASPAQHANYYWIIIAGKYYGYIFRMLLTMTAIIE
ncbi:hypothetical protein EMIT0P12_30368 [Pseudomonas sp. IT-P12]